MMIRLSMLCLYLRISSQSLFRMITYAVMTVNVIYSIVFIFLSIFQCDPLHAAWARWDGTVSAQCINVNALGWTSAAINIVLDCIVVILPIQELLRVVISWQQKVNILVMFALGSL